MVKFVPKPKPKYGSDSDKVLPEDSANHNPGPFPQNRKTYLGQSVVSEHSIATFCSDWDKLPREDLANHNPGPFPQSQRIRLSQSTVPATI
jgi:hypothetical protein